MPELPEVAVYKKYLDATSLKQKIDTVETGDKQVYITDPSKLKKQLPGHEIRETSQHGKYLFAKLESDMFLVLHFGMTGDLAYFKEDTIPKYCQLLLRFENQYRLAYTCVRKLGKIGLIDHKDTFIEKQGLGPDAYQVEWEHFLEIMESKRGMIKSAFMDQSTLAGLGNIFADEILFQEKLHPKKPVSELGEKELKSLFHTMKNVIETSIKHKADPDKLPEGYLIPHRKKEASCPRCKGSVEKITISGRSTWFCPSCQDK